MVKIEYFGYDTYELNHDLSDGSRISSKVPKGHKGLKFKSVGECLKYVSKSIGFAYRKNDWCYEEEVTPDGKDAWVCHVIVEKGTMKYATEKMMKSWKKDGSVKLVDLLVNVEIGKCEEKENDGMKKKNCSDEMELVDLVEELLAGIDEEMEHGCYSAPDGVPYNFEDEEDYYGNHEKIVDENVKMRIKLEKLIKKIRKGK